MEKINPRNVIEVPSDVFVTYRALHDHFGEDHGLTVRIRELVGPVTEGLAPQQIEISEFERDLIVEAWQAKETETVDSLDREHVKLRLAGVSIKEKMASYIPEQIETEVIIIDEDDLVMSGLSIRDFVRS